MNKKFDLLFIISPIRAELRQVKWVMVILGVSFLLSRPIHAQSQKVTTRLYVPLSSNTVLVKEGNKESMMVKDYLGSTRVVDSDGKIDTGSYFPYGKETNFQFSPLRSTSFEGQAITNFQSNPNDQNSNKTLDTRYHIPDTITDKTFTGHRDLSDSNILHMAARFYNPQTGSFIQPDVAEGPNRYSYVGGNPISKNDPTGHCSSSNPLCLQTGESLFGEPRRMTDEEYDMGARGMMYYSSQLFQYTVGLTPTGRAGIGAIELTSGVRFGSGLIGPDEKLSDVEAAMAMAAFIPLGGEIGSGVRVSEGEFTLSVRRDLLKKATKLRYMTPEEVDESMRLVEAQHNKVGVAAWAKALVGRNEIAVNPNAALLPGVKLAHEGTHLGQGSLFNKTPQALRRLFGYVAEADAYAGAREKLGLFLKRMSPQDPRYAGYLQQYEEAGSDFTTHLGYAREELSNLLNAGHTPNTIAQNSGNATWYLARYLDFHPTEVRGGILGLAKTTVWSIGKQ